MSRCWHFRACRNQLLTCESVGGVLRQLAERGYERRRLGPLRDCYFEEVSLNGRTDLARNATRALPFCTHGIASRPSTTTWSPCCSAGGVATGTVTRIVSASASDQATSFTAYRG